MNKLLLLLLFLTGCASFSKPTNEIRVTSYSGNAEPPIIGSPVEGQLSVDGCRLVIEGNATGCLFVEKPGCTYQSAGCPALP